jgi:hypothetical protein
MKLADFDEMLWAGRPGAHWHYVVAPDGQIWIGSEELLTAVSDAQLRDLFTAMQAKDPALTIEQLKASINEQGHPTIGARFTPDGLAWAGPARISGELSRGADGVWTVNDKSGRYMSDKVRPGVQPADVKRWLTNVAARMSDHFGTEVRPQPYKHSEAPPPPPPPPHDAPPPPPAPHDAPPSNDVSAPPALPPAVLNLLADTTKPAPLDAGTFAHLREPAETDHGMTSLASHLPPPATDVSAHLREPAEADQGMSNLFSHFREPAETERPVDLDFDYGPAVYPKKVKPFELSPPQPRDAKGVKGDALRTQEVRVNPALMPLSDFHDFVWAGRPDAHWHYVVDPDGQIWIGSEELLTAVSDTQLQDLFTAMQAKDPALTIEQLKASINEQGHPTIGARFTADGVAVAGPARISGELSRGADGVWTVNDKSGRYMSDKVRPGVQPADVQRWLTNVARRIAEQLGDEVRAVPYKHSEPAPVVPEQAQAALPPDVLALLKP